jgi:UDP-GlcNAc:undecaprenyl-phosphate GlcNAc-1-phosphate transferase
MPGLPAVFLATLVVSVVVQFVARPLLRRARVFDVPSARSSHSSATIRGAGIGLWVAVQIGLAVSVSAGYFSGLLYAAAVVATTGAATLGFVEDVRGMPILSRLAFQVSLGVISGALIAWATRDWRLLVLVGLLAPILINITNFMDGVDNISAFGATIIGLSFAAIGWLDESPTTIATGLLLAAGSLGFVPWNNGRWKMFLGDSGSYLVGSVLVLLVVGTVAAGAPLFSAFAPVLIYVADTLTTLVTRIAQGQNWTQSHRQHKYHQLEDLGWSHTSIALLVAAFSTVVGALGVAGVHSSPFMLSFLMPAAFLTCAVYVCLPSILGRRRDVGIGTPS